MSSLKEYFGRQRKFPVTILGIGMLVFLGFADYLTGPEISFTFLYFLPIYLVARFAGKRQGLLISTMGAATWFIADLAMGDHYSNVLIPYWNALMLLGIFIVVTNYISALKELNEHLEQNVRERTITLTAEIHERIRAEESLRESEQRFRSLSEASSEGIGVSENGVITDISNRMADMLGYTAQEMVGKSVVDFVAPESLDLVKKHFQSGSEEPYEHLARRKDGSVFPVEVRARVITSQDRVLRMTALRDISDRKRAEEILKGQQEFLRKVIDLNPGFIFAKDREGRFTLVNQAVADTYGTTVENLIGKTDADFNSNAEEVEFFRRMDLEVMDSRKMKFIPEERITAAGGKMRWLQTVKIPIIGNDGCANQILGVSTDISERKRVEQLQDAVYRISAAVASSASLDDLFRAVHQIIGGVMPAKNFYIALYDDKTEILSFPYFVDEVDITPPAGNVGKGLTAYVLRTGKSLLCDEKLFEVLARRGDAELVGAPASIWLGVPLAAEQKTIGVMVVQHYSDPGAYREPEKQILEFISSEVARAIDRKWAEEKIRESEERYRRLIEMSPDAIAVHSNGKVVFANSATARLLGASTLDEVIGKPLREIVHPDYWQVVTERVRQMTEERKEAPLLEEKFVRLDGKPIDVEVAAIPFTFRGEPAVQVVVRDITERRRVQRALELQTSYFQQLFESSPAGIVLLGRNNEILNANRAFEQMFQYPVGELKGKDIDDLIVPETLQSEGEDLSVKSQRGEVVQKETVRMRKDGSLIGVSIAGYPIVIENQRVGIYGMYIDISERRKLEDQLRQAQKMEGIGTLAGGIAHDFNNVLGIILAYTSVIQQGKIDAEKQSQCLETIEKAVQRGASLVRQLLTFARKTDVLLESLNLNELVTELATMLKETFPKTITFSVQLDKQLPSIIGDRNQIHQALLNLCLNSRDAMPRGGTITFTTEIQDRATLLEQYSDAQDEQYIRLSVTDTGEGMDEATLGRIFEPFFTTKARGKGTGLGLAVAYGVVKSHRGYIDVESTVGKGTTFHLYFPVPSQKYESLGVAKEELKDVVGGKETILIVEDEEVLLDLVTTICQAKGYTILTARDGEEAVKTYAEHKEKISLVLTDLGLPKLGGFEEFLEIKRINPNVKVIFASGYVDPQLRGEMLKTGAQDFVQKPYEPNKILKKIREVLDKK
jgi:PAS domain S-box-containing protein